MSQDELYEKIIKEFLKTGSVKKTAENVGTTLVRAQRVLITEGLWSSSTSEAIRELWEQGLTTKEIAKKLFISVKAVQAYLPYTKGYYGSSNRSDEARKSEAYRKRKRLAASNQVGSKKQEEADTVRTIDLSSRPNELDYSKLRTVYRLKLELDTSALDAHEHEVIRKYGKAEKGITREIIVPSDLTLHALNYAVQKAFGWQNCHMHKFSLPENVFAKLTDGTYTHHDEYLRRNGSFIKWAKLCGTYFRFESDDSEDLYWDDDYDGSISIKTWLKRKYNKPNSYKGNCEHLVVARNQADVFIRENPTFTIRTDLAVVVFENKPMELRELSISDLTISDYELGEFAECNTLLERLPIDQVLRPSYEATVSDDEMEAFIDSREKLYQESIGKYFYMSNGTFMPQKSNRTPWDEDRSPVFPVTDRLSYMYDLGDNWIVNISCEEVYYIKTPLDGVEGCVVVPVEDKTFEDACKVYDHEKQEIMDKGLSSKIVNTGFSGKLRCVGADGLGVFDDVGGVFGYVDFLRNIHGSDDKEEVKELKGWASNLGWTGRKMKPETLI